MSRRRRTTLKRRSFIRSAASAGTLLPAANAAPGLSAANGKLADDIGATSPARAAPPVGSLGRRGRAQDALGRPAAEAFLKKAEQMASLIHTRGPTDVTILVPLDLTRRALAEHSQKAGDSTESQHWRLETQQIWREFPDQNEFVRRKAAAN